MFAAEVPARFTREMGYTRREFIANLDAALKGRAYRLIDESTIEVPVNSGRVVIRLGDERERRIASLVLPAMEVEFCFENLDPEQRQAFYAAFQRSFQKGGG